MVLKNQAWIAIPILVLPFLLSYSTTEATRVASPGEDEVVIPPSAVARGFGKKNTIDVASNLGDMIPMGLDTIQALKKQLDESSCPCLNECMHMYEEEVMEIKRFVDLLTISGGGADFQSTLDREKVLKCHDCLVEAPKEDPDVTEPTQWFAMFITKASEQINIHNELFNAATDQQ